MAKVLLVEDDNNLREIYEARLLAEGYEIVSAKDGEEALAVAVKEKPDLIIADIMMPKISGFDMLDILRDTPETKDTKIIMMTALNQVEDKDRASKLGADRYLVKSQVTLEDVARVSHEVLEGKQPGPADNMNLGVPPSSETTTPNSTSPPSSLPPVNQSPVGPQATMSNDLAMVEPKDNAAANIGAPAMSFSTPTPNTPTAEQVQSVVTAPVNSAPAANDPATQLAASPAPTDNSTINDGVLADAVKAVSGNDSAATLESLQKRKLAGANAVDKPNQAPDGQTEAQSKTVVHTKVINPINDVSNPQDSFQNLIAKEQAKEESATTTNSSPEPQAIVGDVKDDEKHVSLPGGDSQQHDPSSISL